MVNKGLYEQFVDLRTHEDKEQKIHEVMIQLASSFKTHDDLINELHNLDVYLDLERKFILPSEGSERKW